MMLSIYLVNQKIYKIDYEYGRIFWIMAYLVLALLYYYLLEPGWLIRIVLLLIMPLLIPVLRLFREDEKALIKRFLAK
jgi:hypothetical protein